jgi:hypothetical protein
LGKGNAKNIPFLYLLGKGNAKNIPFEGTLGSLWYIKGNEVPFTGGKGDEIPL